MDGPNEIMSIPGYFSADEPALETRVDGLDLGLLA